MTETVPFDLLLPRACMKDLCDNLPPLGRRAQYVALRQPVNLSAQSLLGVRGLYALAPFRCRTSASEVRELFISGESGIDERTARCFTGLVNLSISPRSPVRLAWFEGGMCDGLDLSDRSALDWPPLRTMKLNRLSLDWTEMPLAHLPASLRWLNLAAWGRLSPKQLEPLRALSRLETLRLTNVPLETLAKVAAIGSLTELSIGSTRSFNGIRRLERLRSFKVRGATCPPLSQLVGCEALRELTLRVRDLPPDLEAMGKLVLLEKLTLDLGDINGLVDVDSFGFLRSLAHLRELTIRGVRLRDRDVTPIAALTGVKVLNLHGAFGPGMGRLGRTRSGKRVTIIEAPDRRPDPLAPILIDGTWSLFADVSAMLGLKNNHDAERAVRRQLASAAPELAGRLEFDSEGGAFGANASSRSDARRLAAIIRSMTTGRKSR